MEYITFTTCVLQYTKFTDFNNILTKRHLAASREYYQRSITLKEF